MPTRISYEALRMLYEDGYVVVPMGRLERVDNAFTISDIELMSINSIVDLHKHARATAKANVSGMIRDKIPTALSNDGRTGRACMYVIVPTEEEVINLNLWPTLRGER